MKDSLPQPHGHSNTAVLALDLQCDFLSDDARLPIEKSQIEPLLRVSNAVVDAAGVAGVRVVYVGNEFRSSDIVGNLFRRHAAMRGSSGAELDSRVHRVGDVYFAKNRRNAFTNAALDAYLRRMNIDRVVVLGVFADACVRATALEAMTRGYRVTVVRDAVGAASVRDRDAALARLAEAGAAIALGSDLIRELAA